MKEKWLVVTGDVDEGFTFYGPFKTPEAADDWAKDEPFYPHYVLAPLQRAGEQ